MKETGKKVKKNTILKEEKTEKEIIIKQPELNLSGIVYDNKKPIAILNNKVVEEKDYIGEYQIYKIFPEKIIIRYRNRYFVINPFKKETKND